MRRIVVGLWAILAYIAQMTVVIGRLTLRGAWGLAGEFLDDNGLALLKVVVVIVIGLLAWRHWDFVVFVLKYDWANDRGALVRIAIFGVKAIGLLAGLLGVALGVTVIALGLVTFPLVTLAAIGKAWVRGALVAWRALRAVRVAQAPPDAPPDDVPPLLVQVSDLHIGAPGLLPYEIEVAPAHRTREVSPTSERLCARLKRILDAASRRSNCPILITGDITDTGAEAEWEVVIRTLSPYATRLALAPGNHDISINRTAEPDFTCGKRVARQARFVEACRRLDPSLDRADYGDLFPIRRPLARGATLFVLDSNRYPSRYVLSNAVGLHGESQLSRLEQALAVTEGPIVVATHHHPVRHSGEGFSAEDIYMIAIDGRRLLAILKSYQARRAGNSVLIVHGHRHLSMYGRHAGMLIYGHPSSTLGQSSDGTIDGAGRYASIHLSEHNEWFVVVHKVESELSDAAVQSTPVSPVTAAVAEIAASASE